jgi:hypothetical protein
VSSSASNSSGASAQKSSPELTNSGNPNTANPSSTPPVIAINGDNPPTPDAATSSSSNADATSSLPVLDPAPSIIPDYNATATIIAAASSTASANTN